MLVRALELAVGFLQQHRPHLSSVAAVVEHRIACSVHWDKVVNNNLHPLTIAPKRELEDTTVRFIIKALSSRHNNLGEYLWLNGYIVITNF